MGKSKEHIVPLQPIEDGHRLWIGIDTGVHTGMAIWNTKTKTLTIKTVKIHQAMDEIRNLMGLYPKHISVRFEDARQRRWYGKAGKEQLQGAGSIKRDCTIWEDFLKDYGIPFQAIAPRHNRTKLNKLKFAAITGYKGQSSEHARDAAMLVFGL